MRGELRKNLANTRAILGDLIGAKALGEVNDNAAARKPTPAPASYGIPLCLGFISYLVYLHGT